MTWRPGPNLRISERRRLYDAVTVKQYGDRYKLTYHRKGLVRGGLELPSRPPKVGEGEAGEEETKARFEASLSRTRSKVFELAACNPWEWFCTFTLADDRGFDRYDLAPWHKDFAQWLRNLRRNHGAGLRYLIVPETHKDGAWHMHALMMGVPDKFLRQFAPGERLPDKLRAKVGKGQQVYDWPAYRQKYGWVTLEPIRDPGRCASYLAKYVTKAMSEPTLSSNTHLYYASQGLERAQLLHRGYMHIPPDFAWDFTNDFVSIKWADSPAGWVVDDVI